MQKIFVYSLLFQALDLLTNDMLNKTNVFSLMQLTFWRTAYGSLLKTLKSGVFLSV